jgi:RNA 3'-terminal phosphate cyclase (GTP)
MLEIDGSYGEGGGQLVRTAVALSVIFKKPIRVTSIRAGRCDAGLKSQHLYAIKALQEFTNAETKGLELGSPELTFTPGKWARDEVTINIPTAGSIGLVLQCLVPALINAPIETKIIFEGGATCGKWAPSLDFMTNVLFPNLRLFGIKPPKVIVDREGYYPKGGARVKVKASPSKVKPIKVLENEGVKKINGISHASQFLKERKVAERQAKAAKELLKYKVDIKTQYSESVCPGSSITLWTENGTRIGADALGERGKTSEAVGKEAAQALLKPTFGCAKSSLQRNLRYKRIK